MLNSSIRRDQTLLRKPRQGDLNAGELVINAVDGTAWTKLSNNDVVPIRAWAIGGVATGGGSSTVTPTALPIATHHSLGVVQIGAHLDIDANGVLDVNIPGGALHYKGVANPPDVAPSNPDVGDTWILTAGAFGGSWTGVAGQAADAGDMVLWDGIRWDLIAGANHVAGVHEVRVTAPILLGGTAKDPVIGVRQASNTETGVVRLATQAELASGSLDAVITASQFKPVHDAAFAPGVAYNLPPATTQLLGGVIVGSGLRVAADGTLSSVLGVMNYKGTVNPPDHPPQNPASGDTYITAAGTFTPEWPGVSGMEATAGDLIFWDGVKWDLVAGANHVAGVHQVFGSEPIYLAGTAKDPEIHVRDASTNGKGVVQLADATAISAGTPGRVVDAAQLKAATPTLPIATTTTTGVVQVGDHLSITPAGRLSAVFPGVLTFRGTLNASSNAPNGASAGDTWLFRDSGTLNSSWGALAGQAVNDHDMAMMDDAGAWHIVGDIFTGVLAGVTADEPLHIDRTDPQHPHIQVRDASQTQKGVVQIAGMMDVLLGNANKAIDAAQLKKSMDAVAGIANSANTAAQAANNNANNANNNANNRVLRTGDTMTGTLKMADGNNWFQFGKEGGFSGTSSGRETPFFYVETPDADSDLKFRFQHWVMDPAVQKNATIESKQELKLFGKKVELFAEFSQTHDGPMYSFRSNMAHFTRTLEIRPAQDDDNLALRGNETNNRATFGLSNRDATVWYGGIKSQDTVVFEVAAAHDMHIITGENGAIYLKGGGGAAHVAQFMRGGTAVATVATQGDWVKLSDIAQKRDIRVSDYGLGQVLKLRPVHFFYKHLGHNGAEQLGFIAQEVQEVVPEAVVAMSDGELGLASSTLIPVLVKAVQELAAQVRALTARVDSLQPE